MLKFFAARLSLPRKTYLLEFYYLCVGIPNSLCVSPTPMSAFHPDCVRLDEKGKHWAGIHITGAGTQWQPMLSQGTIVRPPPGNLRCEGCQRAPGEVPVYGSIDDPLPGDYSGAILVKRPRGKGLLGWSWECRECVTLSDEDYERALKMR